MATPSDPPCEASLVRLPAADEAAVQAGSFWETGPAVIYAIRRPG